MEKKALLARMDRLFRIPPAKVKAKDGSGEMITLEHRIGRDGGYFTREHLMDKMGLENDYKDYCKELNKKIHNNENLKEMMSDRYRTLKGKLNRIVTDYRRYLVQFYGNRGVGAPLAPMFAFVPVTDKEAGLYIQGLRRDTLEGGENAGYKLVIGEPSDDLAWCEVTFSQTERQANLNKQAQFTARGLLSHPGLSKEIRHRIQSIAQGKLPEKLTYNGGEEHK